MRFDKEGVIHYICFIVLSGRIVEQASSLFNPSPKEAALSTSTENSSLEPEPKTSTQITDNRLTDTADAPYDAVVVDANFDLPPVRSNVDLDKPLRPKPPSDGVFKVTPAPSFSSNSAAKYGVPNPNFYSDNLGPTDNYGQDDFMVETVKLDKAFFHQFFTSKPLLLGTSHVTSKSVEVDKNFAFARKRSRKTSADLPEALIHDLNMPKFTDSKLQQMAKNHQHQKTTSPETTTMSSTTSTSTTTTTLKPETEKRTTAYVQNTSKKISDVPKIINSVKTFTRYYIPPEVKISHSVATS